jgi:flagellar protein FlbD
MILLTRLDSSTLYVNSDLIEMIETTPDTIVSFVTGRKLVVREDAATIAQRVADYRRRTHGVLARPAILDAGAA